MSNEKSETLETSENSEIIKIRSVALAGGLNQPILKNIMRLMIFSARSFILVKSLACK